MEFNILHTNDIHSAFEQFSKAVTKINELRNENTLLFDAGDFADFKRLELQGTDGMAAVELLENAGYDAIAIGNNETFNGIDILVNMAVNSRVPFLSCNLYMSNGTAIDGVKSSIIIEKAGIRFLVMGLSPSIGTFDKLMGLYIKPYVQAVSDEMKLQAGKYDICIVLSHIGMDGDLNIAKELSGVDVIIGGHFHILMDKPKLVNETLIFTSGCFGEHVGYLKVNIDSKSLELIEGENINVEKFDQSKEILDILRTNKEKAIDKLGKPLYSIHKDLWHDVAEENPMTNLLADALTDTLKCEIGIINSGVLNGGIRKGGVSVKKLLELCPSPLNPTSFEILGKHLKEALENSLDNDYCFSSGKGPGFRGKYLGRLHVSNAIIEHDGRSIKNIFINGKKLDEERWYTVASSDYLQRGTGYTSLKNNRNQKYNNEYLRETLREYLNNKDFVEEAFRDRWINLR